MADPAKPAPPKPAPPKPARITGPAHLLAAARYSLGGLRRLWQEAAFRHELLAFPAVLGLAALFGAGAPHYLGFGILFALLIAVEALNTAIEVLVDHASPGWSEMARDAKDLGSLAVMCVLAAHGLLLAHVVLT